MRPTSIPTHLPHGMAAPLGEPERFAGIRRDYTAGDVERLAGSFRVQHTLAEMGAARLWHLLHTEPYVPTLGALTGNQALQQVKAGLQAIYLSGWQVAADANTAGQMYPDQSLYPVELGAGGGEADQRRAAPGGSDRPQRGHRRHLLDGADHRRCGSRLRRAAERL